MTRGIRRRATFAALRTEGRRARRRGLSVVYVPTATDTCEVAFAIPRRAGSAVRRNRCRRRLRALLDARVRAGSLPGGAYLLSVQPELVDAPQHELAVVLDELLARVVPAA